MCIRDRFYDLNYDFFFSVETLVERTPGNLYYLNVMISSFAINFPESERVSSNKEMDQAIMGMLMFYLLATLYKNISVRDAKGNRRYFFLYRSGTLFKYAVIILFSAYYFTFYATPDEEFSEISESDDFQDLYKYMHGYRNAILYQSLALIMLQMKIITSAVINEDTDIVIRIIKISMESLVTYGALLFSLVVGLAFISHIVYGCYIEDFTSPTTSAYSIFAIFSFSDYRLKALIFQFRPEFSVGLCALILILVYFCLNNMFTAVIFDSYRFGMIMADSGAVLEGSLAGLLAGVLKKVQNIVIRVGNSLSGKSPTSAETASQRNKFLILQCLTLYCHCKISPGCPFIVSQYSQFLYDIRLRFTPCPNYCLYFHLRMGNHQSTPLHLSLIHI
eukprot:TRINITY_DN8540_c0_g2_i1.p1 TRINITY_DN8540_c0_g2~~TRINITY_DN8540_c0_g2_i1.p1  ORF type:complete len:391 (+),score=15.25 TRINITY_DN8540_c0_g2_i1:84-1256(+)